MIVALAVAITAGFIQFILDTVLFSAVFAFKATKGILAVLIKLLIYGLGFYLLFKLFKAFVVVVSIGFAIGFFRCLFAYAVKNLAKK